tara:strand:- start:63 stop:221 length:159 start_codon:yes stop_codon:yes gene_type:complete
MTTFVQKDGTVLEINPVDSRLKMAVALENSGEQAKANKMLDKALFAEKWVNN